MTVRDALGMSLPLLLAAVCGCASLDAGPAFSRVQGSVAERTGHLVRWNRNTDEDAAVAARVRAMLADELTAEEAVQVALLNNRRLQAVYEELGIAQANLVQAGLLKNPIFDADVKLVDNVPGEQAVFEMSLIQDFLDVLLIPLRKRLAEAELQVAQTRVTAMVLDMAADTKIAFVRHQAAEQSLALQREILAAADASYDAARRLREAGNTTELALAEKRALYEQSRLSVSRDEVAVVAARERMNKLMGLWGEATSWRTAGSLPPVPDQPVDLDDLELRALARNLDLAMLRDRMRVVVAETGIDATKLVFPELAGGVAAEMEPDDTWMGGPAVSIGVPVFDWGQARTAAGRAMLRQLWDRYTAMAIEVRSVARAARFRLATARQQSEHYRRVMVPLAERITGETQLQYNAMQLGVFQLLDAKRREIEVRRNYVLAQRDYWIARTEVEQLVAGRMFRGTRADLEAAGGPMPPGGQNGH